MNLQPNYIVFLCYGNKSMLHECMYALLSLSRLYPEQEPANVEVWIYTDDPGWFQSFKDCSLSLHFRTLDNKTIKQWKGGIDFAHRVKIEMLKEFSQNRNGNILYVDSDSVFTHRIDKVFEQIQKGKLYMHVSEGIVSDKANPILKKLNRHLQKDSLLVNGKPVHDLAMWNAGVIGFNTKYNYLPDEALAFTDSEYPRFPKHIVEQFAFSVYFQQAGEIKAAAPYIMHYWYLKEVRAVLASFFEEFKDNTWAELAEYSRLIQMDTMMREKVSFFHNRNILQLLRQKQWLPEKRNWKELLKQL